MPGISTSVSQNDEDDIYKARDKSLPLGLGVAGRFVIYTIIGWLGDRMMLETYMGIYIGFDRFSFRHMIVFLWDDNKRDGNIRNIDGQIV